MLVVSKSRYEREIGKLEEEIEELSSKLRKSNARLGGYQSNLTKSKSLIESLRIDNENYEKELEIVKSRVKAYEDKNLQLSEDNKTLANEIIKLRGIIENLNDIISKKMRKVPTVSDIVNYDRKQPLKK